MIEGSAEPGQAPATPDGVFVRGQDWKAAKAVGGRPTVAVKPPICGNPEDLNAPQLKDLELTLERPAAKLPATLLSVCTTTRRLRAPGSIVVGLQFSDLIVPLPEIA
jgi:hypothetical protein